MLEIAYGVGGGTSGPAIQIGPVKPGNGTTPGTDGPNRKIQ
ncbi:unnamed protein product, partial [Rotaria sordida]